jgi:hypothetical protein
LNSANSLVRTAVARNDRLMLGFLISELFAEFLFFRGRSFPLVQALQTRLAAKIFCDPSLGQFKLLTNLATGLASSFIANQLPLPLTTKRQLVYCYIDF